MTTEELKAISDAAWQAAEDGGWTPELSTAWNNAYNAYTASAAAEDPDAEFIAGGGAAPAPVSASAPTPSPAAAVHDYTGMPDPPTLAEAAAAEDAAWKAGQAGGWTPALTAAYDRARAAEIAATEAAGTAVAAERLPMLAGGEPSTIPGSDLTSPPDPKGVLPDHLGVFDPRRYIFGTNPASTTDVGTATADSGGSTWVDYGDSGGSSWASGDSVAPANPYGPDDAMREGGLHAGRMGEALRGWMGAPQPYMPGQDQTSGGYRTPAYSQGGASVDSFGNPTPAYAPSGEGRYPPWPGAYQTRQAMTGAGGGMSHTMPDGSIMAGPPMGGGRAPLPTTALGRDVRDRIAAAYAQGRVAPPQAGPLPGRGMTRTEVHRGGRNNRRGR